MVEEGSLDCLMRKKEGDEEAPTRVVVSALPGNRDQLLSKERAAGVPAAVIGRTGGPRVTIGVAEEIVADVGLDAAEQAWSLGLTRHFERAAS